MGLICFHAKISWTIINAFFILLAGGTAELLAGMIVAWFNEIPFAAVMEQGVYRLQSRTMASLILLAFVPLISRFKDKPTGSMAVKSLLIFCIPLITSAYMVIQIGTLIASITHTPTMIEGTPLLSVIIINIFVFIVAENIMITEEEKRKRLHVEMQNSAQQNHIKQLIENNLNIRKISHDFRHQVQILHTLCQKGKYDELLSRLSQAVKNRNKDLLISTENIMLDSILSSKLEEAVKENIDFKIKNLDVAPNISHMNLEICVLLGNALENAIEACMRVEAEKVIELELEVSEKLLVCNIVNTIGEPPQLMEDGFLKSSKLDDLHHGVGMRSMEQTCEDFGGELIFKFDEKYFYFWIIVPFK